MNNLNHIINEEKTLSKVNEVDYYDVIKFLKSISANYKSNEYLYTFQSESFINTLASQEYIECLGNYNNRKLYDVLKTYIGYYPIWCLCLGDKESLEHELMLQIAIDSASTHEYMIIFDNSEYNNRRTDLLFSSWSDYLYKYDIDNSNKPKLSDIIYRKDLDVQQVCIDKLYKKSIIKVLKITNCPTE